MSLNLPYVCQSLDEDDVAAVTAVLRSGHLTTGSAVDGFERVLSERFDGADIVSCSNGTATLHLAALANR